MKTTYAKLAVITLDPAQHAQTCGYWYLVQNQWTAHTAFAKREHLMAWLEARGLRLSTELPAHGTWSVQPIIGSYVEQVWGNLTREQFDSLSGLRGRRVSNARYTTTILSTGANGIRTEHTMNCNCADREEFDYAESRAMVG